MLVGELIQHLQKLSPDTKVVVRGYEGGYNDIIEIKPVKIIRKPEAPWYEGEYDNDTSANSIEAFELYGTNNNDE